MRIHAALLVKITAGELGKDPLVSDANEQAMLSPPQANKAQPLIGVISSERV